MDVSDPARGGGDSVFEFQDSLRPTSNRHSRRTFRLRSMSRSPRRDPANPVSHLGIALAPSFEIHPFDLSDGDPQTASSTPSARSAPSAIHWTVNGGEEQSALDHAVQRRRALWRPAGTSITSEMRGAVSGTEPGDDVRVWFEARLSSSSQSFGYHVSFGQRLARSWIMAAEDYSGKTTRAPRPSSRRTPAAPSPITYYEDALTGQRHQQYDIYDVDANKPHGTRPAGRPVETLTPRSSGTPATTRWDPRSRRAWRHGDRAGSRTTRSSRSATTSTTAASCCTQARTPPSAQLSNALPVQPARSSCLTATLLNTRPTPNSGAAGPAVWDDFLQYWLGAYVHIDAAADKDQASALARPGASSSPFGDIFASRSG